MLAEQFNEVVVGHRVELVTGHHCRRLDADPTRHVGRGQRVIARHHDHAHAGLVAPRDRLGDTRTGRIEQAHEAEAR